MGRILIDTDDLRALGGDFRAGAQAVSSVGGRLRGQLASIDLNSSDPAIRGARVPDRQADIDRELARIADGLRDDAGYFVSTAQRVEVADAAGGILPFAIDRLSLWSGAGVAVGGVVGGGLLGGLVGLVNPVSAIASLRQAGLAALNAVSDTASIGTQVGRWLTTGSLGLLGQAASGFAAAVDWLGDRLAHLIESAWNAIWDGVTAILQGVVAALSAISFVAWSGGIGLALIEVLVNVLLGRTSSNGTGLPGAPSPPPPDAGSGRWGSEWPGPWEYLYLQKLHAIALGGGLAGYPNAARHLRHFLSNTGAPLRVDVDDILADQSKLEHDADDFAHSEARRAASNDGRVGVPIPFRTDWRTFEANGDWFYALGTFSYAVTGTVTRYDDPPRLVVRYQVHVFDYYNWNAGQGVGIGDGWIKDDDNARLHRAGLAREFEVSGSSSVREYEDDLIDVPSY
jgi:hypothetical protein